MAPTAIDIIGDVHGRSAPLRALLEGLGYRERASAYRHPSRRAVFMGDLVDRGPDVGGTLALVRAMVEAEAAEVLLGNHELNLLRWFTGDGQGGHLRPHSERNRHQAAATLRWCEAHPREAAETLDWFQDRPLFLGIGSARFVHACWHPADVALLGPRRTLRDLDGLRPAFRESPEGQAVERLLKGPEVLLPEGLHAPDADGRHRKEARVAWWKAPEGLSFQEAVLTPLPGAAPLPFPPEAAALLAPPEPGTGPIFVGHYQLPGPHGALHPRVACVDFGGPGRIGAYRWEGEPEIRIQSFVP